jgi:hypothetical protein
VLFPAWETFYVIVGSSAGALTGLMFVVIALVADFGGNEQTIHAFGTPTVVHLSSGLLLSVIVTAPWPGLLAARVAVTAFGAAGAVYMIVVTRRARQQTGYKPVFEDWLFHAVLPVAAYAGILIGGAVLATRTSPALFVVGGAAVLLMFVGLHNAWDTVTYVVVARWERAQQEKNDSSRKV